MKFTAYADHIYRSCMTQIPRNVCIFNIADLFTRITNLDLTDLTDICIWPADSLISFYNPSFLIFYRSLDLIFHSNWLRRYNLIYRQNFTLSLLSFWSGFASEVDSLILKSGQNNCSKYGSQSKIKTEWQCRFWWDVSLGAVSSGSTVCKNSFWSAHHENTPI